MFKVDTSIGEVEVRFKHAIFHHPNGTTGFTDCKISTQPASFGTSRCSPTDNFCRATGRKIALTRAIAAFPREDRAAVWKKYFETCKR